MSQERNISAVPWPSASESEPRSPDGYREPLPPIQGSEAGKPKRKTSYVSERRLNTWNLVALSISMLGVQISWAVELAFGNPLLLDLGVSDQAASLVWLAGPLSGLIAQPLIGALSDASTSKFRRRSWVIASATVLAASGFMLVYCIPFASFLMKIFGGDTEDTIKVKKTAIPIAVISFYLFDFAINGIQASLRNLLLDVTPQDQLSLANAWQGRMLHAGSVVGNGLGWIDLSKLPFLDFLGGNQFRKFCVLAMVILLITVGITCITQEEKEGSPSFGRRKNGVFEAVTTISQAILQLPRPIRRVCYVQIFSWIGWFPFLFFGSTYIGQVMAAEIGHDPTADDVQRSGEFALLLYSIVAVASGTLLPWLASRDRRLMAEGEIEDEDEEISRIRGLIRTWKSEAARMGKPLRLPTMPFMLRNIWTSGLILFAFLMFSTFYVKTVAMASTVIALGGISWAVTCWVPFSILMEYLKEVDAGVNNEATRRLTGGDGPRPGHNRAISTPSFRHRGQRITSMERVPLLRRYSMLDENDLPADDDLSKAKKPLAGGTVMGIHNLAVVFPQFIVSLVANTIFRFANRNVDENNIYFGKSGVAWVLRFGGLCALVAALISRMVPPTKTEKEMRRRLAEMEYTEESGSP